MKSVMMEKVSYFNKKIQEIFQMLYLMNPMMLQINFTMKKLMKL